MSCSGLPPPPGARAHIQKRDSPASDWCRADSQSSAFHFQSTVTVFHWNGQTTKRFSPVSKTIAWPLLILSCGGGWWGWDGRRKKWLVNVLSPSGSSSSDKRERETAVSECCLSVFGPSHPVWGRFRDEGGVSVNDCFKACCCPTETQTAVSSSSSCRKGGRMPLHHEMYRNVPGQTACEQRRSETSQIFYKHTEAAFVGWALDSKCNFWSAISLKKEGTEKEQFDF